MLRKNKKRSDTPNGAAEICFWYPESIVDFK